MITIVMASFLAVVVSGPIHASCKINWWVLSHWL